MEQRLHEILVEWIDQHDYPASLHDLAGVLQGEGCDIRTSTGVLYHLKKLQDAGKIRKANAKASSSWMPVVYPDGRPWLTRAQLLASLKP